MRIYIKNIDACEVSFAGFEDIESVPPELKVKLMMLDAGADDRGDAQIAYLGARSVITTKRKKGLSYVSVPPAIYYALATKWRFVSFTDLWRAEPKTAVSNRNEEYTLNVL